MAKRQDGLLGRTVSRSLRALWTKLWIVLLVMVVCAATAFFYANSQTRIYAASARIMYEPPTDISDPSAGSSSVNTDFMAIQLQSVSTSLQDPKLRAAAEEGLNDADAALDYTVTADVVVPDVSSTSMTFPNTVEITAETVDPSAAAAIANAYAAAVIAQRKENQEKRYKAAQAVVEDQLELYVTDQSKLTTDYAILKQQLRNLVVAAATVTGDFSVVVPAEPSPDPVAPQPLRSAALGLFGGAVVGIVLVYGMSRLDNRLHGHRDVAEAIEAPILGRIPKDRSSAESGDLPTLYSPDGPVSEAFRMTRSNLEWANVDGDVRTLLFTSCLKGEGKTTTVCNLAVAMARAGKTVVVVDADLRAPKVHRVFALPNSLGLSLIVRGTTQLPAVLQTYALNGETSFGGRLGPAVRVAAKGGMAVQGGESQGAPVRARSSASPKSQSAVSAETRSGDSPVSVVKTAQGHEAGTIQVGGSQGVAVRVLTSGPLPPDPGEVVASRRMADVLRQIGDLDADYILIDAPPILSVGDAAALSAYADGVVLIVNVGKVSRPALMDGREQLDALPCRKLGVVVVGEEIEYRHYYQ